METLSMPRALLSLIGVSLVGASLLSAADEETAAPRTLTVETAPFHVVVELPGVFEAGGTTEVRVQPKVWTKLKVKKAVSQGTRVAVGDPLLWLETDEIDDALKDAELDNELARLSLEEGGAELKALEVSVPLDLAAAERAHSEAAEDLAYLEKVGEESSRKSAEESLHRAEEQVEYAQEELVQLEKMYKADDLTEETEEIILLRTRRDVEHARFFADAAKLRFEHDIAIDLPRQRVQTENAATRAGLALERARATLPSSLEQKRIAVQKLKHAADDAGKKLAELKADRGLMIVSAPVAGIVRYGECERGKWKTASQIEGQLKPGESIAAGTTIFTVIAGGPLQVRVDVGEDKLSLCTPGKRGTAIPKGYPEMRLEATLEEVNLIPLSDGAFDGRVSVSGEATPLTAGMTCTVKITAFANEAAVSVPTSAIFPDPVDDSIQFVYVMAGEMTEKRPVKTGPEQNDRTLIREGLKAGDRILLEKPAK